ncbi:unnamed protein product [Darwinula stevensoni]|uniref:Uncharacterized protein n=1 Tax=Darwinula stevensoni TaxID=69355 RepID=A0A7R9FPU3_9CRUS|nr:unnamed protein product [Darwinula stevensoni]CAG0898468.1 unnamed protein product [Darwinula stevensoni]
MTEGKENFAVVEEGLPDIETAWFANEVDLQPMTNQVDACDVAEVKVEWTVAWGLCRPLDVISVKNELLCESPSQPLKTNVSQSIPVIWFLMSIWEERCESARRLLMELPEDTLLLPSLWKAQLLNGRSSRAEYHEEWKAHSITQMLPSCPKLKKCPSGCFKYRVVHIYRLKSVLENRWMDLALLGDSSIIECRFPGRSICVPPLPKALSYSFCVFFSFSFPQ